LQFLCSTSDSRFRQDRHLVTNRIRNAAAALLFLVCLVTLTSAFNLPNTSRDLLSQLASLSPAAKPAQQRTTLTLADRVAYQRAIEEVYWRHRIWPKDNPGPKPALDAVISEDQIEKKVTEYLRKSQVVADQRGRPITASELQAEMDRMASHTKQPDVLREVFAALGNDPFVVAECLARPVLAERLAAQPSDAASESSRAGSRDPVERPLSSSTGFPDSDRNDILSNAATYKLPEISASAGCTDDTWTATTTVNAPDGRIGHTALWTGSEIIIWGGTFLNNNGYNYLNTGGRYSPATDSWIATSTTNAPTPRWRHAGVWTGTEMIVWGGYDGDFSNTGGRYSLSGDSWTAISTVNTPAPRVTHTAVWTGGEMVVWGGYNYNQGNFNTGGRYNPDTDSWTATSTINVPEARWDHTALWTGAQMIVWGGTDDTNPYLNTGGRYNPSTDGWTATSVPNDVLGRVGHSAVWTGGEMIVWGGTDSTFNDCITGGRYNPSTDSWMATSPANLLHARDSHTAVWTGSEMIVWGGAFCYPCMVFNDGARYNPATDSWVATNTTNAPSARYWHTAVWTGSEMVVWGGTDTSTDYFNTGGRYCAQSQVPMAQSAFSQKTHGAAGTFDVPLPLTGNVGIECRSGGATSDYQMIINFATTVTVGSASVTSGTGSVSSFSVSGSQVTVNLTGVTNIQRITVTLFNVNDGTHMGNVPVSMGVLVGDVNGNAVVNAADVALTKSQVGMPVGSSNFRGDVNANGTISATDVAQVKAEVGTALPP
jgi:N-acetylneuraminic acid mutarotase